jgi:aminomethyltransferase
MVEFAGWDMPIQYTSIVEEHQTVRTAAGIFDISHMGRLIFEGPDAVNLIQRIYTNDAASMKMGQVRYGLICNEQGGILDDVLVYRLAPFWLMVVNASNREKILGWIDAHKGKFQVQVKDHTFAWSMLAIQGPKSEELANWDYLHFRFWSPMPTEGFVHNATETELGLKYYFASMMRMFSDPSTLLIISRTGYTGEDGFELIGSGVGPEGLIKTFRECGVALKPCGLGARDTLRLEAGMPLYGHELTEDIDPFQAGLGWAVKMDKGDFIGREALARRRQDKSLRQRVGLELEGKRLAREGASVIKDGKVVGTVTSGTFAPTLAKAIAMAYVDPACVAPGTACEVDIRGKLAAARIVPLPFYRRR